MEGGRERASERARGRDVGRQREEATEIEGEGETERQRQRDRERGGGGGRGDGAREGGRARERDGGRQLKKMHELEKVMKSACNCLLSVSQALELEIHTSNEFTIYPKLISGVQ